MSSVDHLREFVNERLTAAAEEIFRVFKITIVEYEEEIDRQRRLLDICWKPEIKLHRIELPQQHGCMEDVVPTNQQLCNQERNSDLDQEDPEPPQIKEDQEELSSVCDDNSFHFQSKVHRKLKLTELPQLHVCKEEEEVLADQQLCNQERYSSLDQEEPEPLQIKEEQEELCTSQEGEQLVLKQEEIDTFVLSPTHEESNHSEDQTLYFNPDKTLSATEKDSEVNILLESSVASEPSCDLQLISHNSHVAENQDQKGDKHGESGSTRNIEAKQNSQQHKSKSHSTTVYKPTMSKIDHNNHTDKKTLKCDTCGKDFKYKSKLQRHLTSHTGEKPYTCTVCGRAFKQSGDLTVHIRSAHTGDKPYICKTCGKGFTVMSKLKRHTKIHTDEKPYLCSTCGTTFRDFTVLMRHMRVHTGEMPYTCKICGRAFRFRNALSIHTRTHTGEKPYTCNICGRAFTHSGNLTVHMRFHTGEKPYLCNTCGKTFIDSSHLAQHIKTHAGK